MDHEENVDIVEFMDEDGNPIALEIIDSFFHNGVEYAVLADYDENAEGCGCGECAHDHEEHACHEGEDCGCADHQQNVYIMKVEAFVNEDGEEMEEFIPVEDDLAETLIEIVQTRFMMDDEEEDDE